MAETATDTEVAEQPVESAEERDEVRENGAESPEGSVADVSDTELLVTNPIFRPQPESGVAKRELLRLDGMDPETGLYIPSYFRKRVNVLDLTETSHLTVGSLQARIRDIGPGGFPSEVIELLGKLNDVCAELQEPAHLINISFKPGELTKALETLVATKQVALEAQLALTATNFTSDTV